MDPFHVTLGMSFALTCVVWALSGVLKSAQRDVEDKGLRLVNLQYAYDDLKRRHDETKATLDQVCSVLGLDDE